MKKSLARAPLLVPFLLVAACNTAPETAGSLTGASLAASPAFEAAGAEPGTTAPARSTTRRPAARSQVTALAPARVEARSSVAAPTLVTAPESGDERDSFQRGHASWYGPGFHGRRTASGETFNAGAMTAAHRTLPFGTRVRVLNARTGRSVVVRINDRGPFHRGRIIDLATGPAQMLGLTSAGSAYVSLHRLD